jgi:hypothetical protein
MIVLPVWICAVTVLVVVTTHHEVMGSVVGVSTHTGALLKAAENVCEPEVPEVIAIVPVKSLVAAKVWRRVDMVTEGLVL